jgi:hypothetical protein
MSGNTFRNTGDFRGAAVFQGSTINNAGQIAGTLAKADDASGRELQTLLQQLHDALKTVPREKVDDANAVGTSAEDLLQESAKDKPNPSRLRGFGATLIETAKVIGAAAPATLSIVERVVAIIGRIHGLG